MPYADVHVRGTGGGEIRAAERHRERGAGEEEAPEPRSAEEAETRGEKRGRGREHGRCRQLDSEGPRKVERVSLARDLPKEIVETLSRARDSLHEEKPRTIGGDRLRKRAREHRDGALLGQPSELVRDSRLESRIVRTGKRDELDEEESDESDRDEKCSGREDGEGERSS